MAIEDQDGAVAILYVGRVDDDGEDQAEGVDQETLARTTPGRHRRPLLKRTVFLSR